MDKENLALQPRAAGGSGRIPKTVVFGATGFLGSSFLRAYRHAGQNSEGAGRSGGGFRFDLGNPDISGLDLVDKGYENALITAAVADVRRCEEQKDATRRINVDGTLALVEQLAVLGIKPIFLSSDYVFEGARGGNDDKAPAAPTTEYGKHKAEVEAKLPLICGNRHLILRLSKIVGVEPGDRTVLDQVAEGLRKGQPLSSAHDQVYCPTFVDDVVRITLELQRRDITGLLNLAAPQALSRLDIARRIAAGLGADQSLIKPISIDDLGEPFRRPKRTDMICLRLMGLGKFEFADLDRCVRMYKVNLERKNRGNPGINPENLA